MLDNALLSTFPSRHIRVGDRDFGVVPSQGFSKIIGVCSIGSQGLEAYCKVLVTQDTGIGCLPPNVTISTVSMAKYHSFGDHR